MLTASHIAGAAGGPTPSTSGTTWRSPTHACGGSRAGRLRASLFEAAIARPTAGEDEAFYILEGQIRFQRGDEDFVGGAGDFVFAPREVPHRFKVLEGGARALVLMTPAGLEHMFLEGGIRAASAPPPEHYDMGQVAELASKYGWDIIGPAL